MLDLVAVKAFVAMAHKRSCAPHEVVVNTGDPPQSLFLILEGSVSAIKEDTDGREILLAYLSPGDFFGEMGLFPQQFERTALVRTRRPTLLAEMSYAAFRPFVQKHPEIMFAIAGQLATRLRDTNRRLSDLAFLDTAGRIASALMSLARSEGQIRPDGKAARIQISRQELARCVGCTREVAGRVLKRLEEDGAIYTNGRAIYVHGDFAPGATTAAAESDDETSTEAETDSKSASTEVPVAAPAVAPVETPAETPIETRVESTSGQAAASAAPQAESIARPRPNGGE